MKLAVITDEIDADLDRAAVVMAEYGVQAAELRQIWDKHVLETSQDDLKRAKDVLDSHGIRVVSIASPFYKCDLPGQEIEGPTGPLHSASAVGLGDQITLLEHSFDVARFFGTNLIRVFSFWKRGILTPEVEEQIVDAFAEPAALAESAGMILGLENEHACYLGTGAQTARVLEKIGSPAVRAIWDPGNAYMDGEKPYPNGYEAIRPFVTHVHIKDATVNAATGMPEWAAVGQGRIDYIGQLAALSAENYPGYLSLETHWSGMATKEESTRVCLGALQQLVAEAA